MAWHLAVNGTLICICWSVGLLKNGLTKSHWISLHLTHWGWVTHISVGKLTIIGSDNGLSPGRRQAFIITTAGILLIGTLGTNFSEILSEIYTFSFKKMHLKMSSGRWRPFCLGLNELTHCGLLMPYDTIGLGQYWFRWCLVAWRHQAINWTNIDWSVVSFCVTHLRAISKEMFKISIHVFQWVI